MVLVTIPRSVRVKRTTLSCESLSNGALRPARGSGGWGPLCAVPRRFLAPCRCAKSFPARLQIVFVGTEVSPWSKVGGLGDVLGSLPPALAKRGHRVMTVSPRYEPYDDIYDSGYLIPVEVPDDVCQGHHKAASGSFSRLFLAHQERVDRVFVDHPLFKPPNRDPSQWKKMIYPYHGGDSKEFEICCSVLCQSALAAPAMVWGKGYSEAFQGGHEEEALVFVANDWPCGILPLWLENYKHTRWGEAEAPSIIENKFLERPSVPGAGNSFRVGNCVQGSIDQHRETPPDGGADPGLVSEAERDDFVGIGPLLGPDMASEKEGRNNWEKRRDTLRPNSGVNSAPLALSEKPRAVKKSKPVVVDPEGGKPDSGSGGTEGGSPFPLVGATPEGEGGVVETISGRRLSKGSHLGVTSEKNAEMKAMAPSGKVIFKPRQRVTVSAGDFETEIGPSKSSRGRATMAKSRTRSEAMSNKQQLILAPNLDRFQAWVGTQVAKSKVVFAIHNMAYQGRNLLLSLGKIRLPWPGDESGSEPPWDWNWLKAGLLWSDKAVTVSPGYAAELMKGGQESCGMGDALEKAGGITGIRNGLDTDSWNPKTDKFLAEELRYGVEDISEKKAAAKALLQKKLNLKVNAQTPLVGFVGRLEFQKGTDVLLSGAPELVIGPEVVSPFEISKAKSNRHRSKPGAMQGRKSHQRKRGKHRSTSRNAKEQGRVQLVMLGRGDKWLEAGVRALKYSFPGNAAGVTEFNEELAHLIMAGCDYLIVPSRFEPCGLVAMCAVAYGCIPIVSPVGGLMELAKEHGVGYTMSSSFHNLSYRDSVINLVTTVRKAVKAYGSKKFIRMRRKCMSVNMSWEGPAEKWEDFLMGLQGDIE